MRHFTTMVGAAGVLMAGAAQAHSPYLLPNTFDATDRDHVSVEASFTEDFLVPDVVMKADDWQVVTPTGIKRPLTAVYTTDLALLEAPTAAPGTYRISTGLRSGRVAKAYEKDGEWVFIEPGKTPPGGETAVDMQSLTMAETYVSRGAPNDTVLAARGAGLEFHPLTHPSKIFVGQRAVFEVLYDGKPVSGQPVELRRAGMRYDATPQPTLLTTDTAGRFTVRAERAGVYHAMTRYRVDPGPAGGPHRSFTYALTFEASQ